MAPRARYSRTPRFSTMGVGVELRYRELQSFGTASGFVLQDDDGLISAVEVGTWGNALEDGEVPGLTVSAGPVYATASADCETQEAYVTELRADEPLALEAIREGELQIAGESYTAIALADWGYATTHCTDVTGARIWAVLRSAPDDLGREIDTSAEIHRLKELAP